MQIFNVNGEYFKLRLLIIFVSVLIIQCDGIDGSYCEFIEILSFGSDIDIKCNSSYLIFSELNNKKLEWKFANQSSFCNQTEKPQGFINQCGITSIGSKYLKAQLQSIDRNEHACIYCPINYKSIAPVITVEKSDDGHRIEYTFNITATGLNHSESFEILSAKRASHHLPNSFNYWFLQRCIHPNVYIIQDNPHTIIFTIDDVDISRVEFIVRRRSGNRRFYERCSEEDLHQEIISNSFQTPDSIEKISCDYNCLNGIVSTTTTTTMTTTMTIIQEVLLSKIELSHERLTIKFLILFPILGLLIVLLSIILGCFIISKIKGLRTDSKYTKTVNVNLDENRENVES